MKIIGGFILGMFAWTLLFTQVGGWPISAALLFSVLLSVISMGVYGWMVRFFKHDYREEKEEPVGRNQDNEAARQLHILDMELINCYTSLSWKYIKISDFCINYPEFIKQLKETEHYKIWRTDVIDWAKDNLYRLESFYFNDGFFLYVNSQTPEGGMCLIELNEKYNYPNEPEIEVICDIEFKRIKLPRDYYESPALVWEDENDDDDDFDYIGDRNENSKASDAFAVGMGIGIVNGLTGGSVFGGGSGGN